MTASGPQLLERVFHGIQGSFHLLAIGVLDQLLDGKAQG
jgi:hypothetical protein